MGYWISYAGLEAKHLPCQNVEELAEALVAATVFSDEIQDICITDEFSEEWEDISGDIINIFTDKDGFSVEYNAEPGENPDTLSAFLMELSKSVVALFPNCEVTADYCAEYSAGDANLGVLEAQNGTISMAEDVISDLWDEINETDSDEDKDDIDEDEDEDEDDIEWAEMEEECRDYLRTKLSVAAQFPNFSVSWDDDTFQIISAAIHAGETERVKAAAEKGVITRTQLEGALAVSQDAKDEDVISEIRDILESVGK